MQIEIRTELELESLRSTIHRTGSEQPFFSLKNGKQRFFASLEKYCKIIPGICSNNAFNLLDGQYKYALINFFFFFFFCIEIYELFISNDTINVNIHKQVNGQFISWLYTQLYLFPKREIISKGYTKELLLYLSALHTLSLKEKHRNASGK